MYYVTYIAENAPHNNWSIEPCTYWPLSSYFLSTIARYISFFLSTFLSLTFSYCHGIQEDIEKMATVLQLASYVMFFQPRIRMLQNTRDFARGCKSSVKSISFVLCKYKRDYTKCKRSALWCCGSLEFCKEGTGNVHYLLQL